MPKLAAIALTVAALIGTLPASPAPAAEMKSEEVVGGWVGELRTLEASVQWSYELTDADERAVLRRLSVFQSAFDLAAAERVAGSGDIDELAVLDLLGRLVDKSLVQMEETPTGEVRYWLLDTIRQFARDRLAEAGEADDAQGRHLAWVRDFAEAAEATLERGDLATLAYIDDQLDDIRVALAWACTDPGRASAAVAIAGALGFYWLLRGRLREGIEWCRRRLFGVLVLAAVLRRAR